jgi:atypical dual specificity phosphatase
VLATRLGATLRGLGLLSDPGTWIDPSCRVLVCAYPRSRRALGRLAGLGIRRLVNLHQRAHPQHLLAAYGLTEYRVPVPDFTAPTSSQLAAALDAIQAAVRSGERVALHCGGGLGRSGTVAACYLVELGYDWRDAVAQVRARRPGAIETPEQRARVAAHAARGASGRPGAVSPVPPPSGAWPSSAPTGRTETVVFRLARRCRSSVFGGMM